MPAVSVICATFNRGAALLSTIRSVMSQSVAELEMVVVSDGSTDDTDAVVARAADQDSRVRPIRIDHVGHPSVAMNAGLRAARGEVICYIDHDDQWTGKHVEVVLTLLESGAELVATNSVWVDPDGHVLTSRPAAAMLWHPEIQVMTPVFENSQAAHRANWAERAGAWRQAPHGLEDWDMWLRMADLGVQVKTSTARTVRKTMARTNRHRRLPAAHSHPLATFPDPAAARCGLAAMGDPASAARLSTAGEADRAAWYDRLAGTDEFVYPVGLRPDRTQLPALLARATEADRGWQDPVRIRLERDADRVRVVQDILCMTAAHAGRYSNLARSIQPRTRAVAAEIIAPYGGQLC